MKKNDIKIKLNINGIEINPEDGFLASVVQNIEDDKKNRKLFNMLASSMDADLLTTIAYKRSIGKKTIEIILASKNRYVLTELAGNKKAIKKLDLNGIKILTEYCNHWVFEYIAKHITKFKQCNLEELANYLIEQENNENIKYALITGCNLQYLPKRIIHKLKKDILLIKKIKKDLGKLK